MPSAKEMKREPVAWLTPVVELLKGGVLAVVVSIAVLLVGALLMTTGVLDRGAGESCVIVAGVLGALVGGWYAIRRCGRGALLVGVGAGLAEAVLLMLVGTIGFGGVAGGRALWSMCTGCACGGLLAGMLSAVPVKRNRRKR